MVHMEEEVMLLTHARILTLDDHDSRAASLAIRAGRIVGLWEEPEPPVEIVRGKRVKTIGLGGAVVLPGFIDTHNHILDYGLYHGRLHAATPPNRSIVDIMEQVRVEAGRRKQGEWILGWGYDDTLLTEQRHPTREDLDQAAPEHPVLIEHISGHLAVMNSYAIRIAGIEDAADPPGGHYGRDGEGRLNGILYESAAQEPWMTCIPRPSVDEMIAAVAAASSDYLGQGITTSTDAHVKTVEQLEAQLRAVESGANPLRMRLMISHKLLRPGAAYGAYTAKQLDEEIRVRSNGRARLDSAKFFQDGSIQGLTGALRQPYHTKPELCGELIHEQRSFEEEVLDLHRRGFRIAIHGNGDRAIGSILDAYEYALKQQPKLDHRHRIEHVQTATPADSERMARLGIAASYFINHVYYWGDRHERLFLGPERAHRISPLREAQGQGLLYTLHSDCPITPISPLFSVWCAVERRTREGRVLGEEQRIGVLEALKAMTLYGAKLNFEEQDCGSLEIGKRADFVVLDADPTAVAPDRIKDIGVKSVWIGGEQVYGERWDSA